MAVVAALGAVPEVAEEAVVAAGATTEPFDTVTAPFTRETVPPLLLSALPGMWWLVVQ